MSHVINSHALTGEKPCFNKAIQTLLMHSYAIFNMTIPGPQICCRYVMCTSRPYKEHSKWKFHSRDIIEKAIQNSARKMRHVANNFSFYAIIAIKHSFSMHWHSLGPLGGVVNLCFQHLPRDLANVNAWKTMFDPYIRPTIILPGMHFSPKQRLKQCCISPCLRNHVTCSHQCWHTFFQTKTQTALYLTMSEKSYDMQLMILAYMSSPTRKTLWC